MKIDLDQIRKELEADGWEATLTPESYDLLAACPFRAKLLKLAIVATQILVDEQPMTLRGLFYRVVSAGWLPNTNREHYQTLGRVMTILREAEVVPFRWL